MPRILMLVSALGMLGPVLACSGNSSSDDSVDAGGDTDTDSDADGDADSDADADADADTDADADSDSDSDLNSGDLVWATSAVTDVSTFGALVGAFNDDSTVIAGVFRGGATFGAGEINETTLTASGGEEDSDFFFARLNADGTLDWAKQAGSVDSTGFIDAIDTQVDDVGFYIAGVLHGDTTFGSGEANETTVADAEGFVARYQPDGSLSWALGIGTGGQAVAEAVESLSDGGVVVTGVFIDSIVFGQGEANETTLVSAGGGDIFIARYSANGDFVWAKQAGGDLSQDEATDHGFAVAACDDDSFVVSGTFLDNSVFGPGEPGETAFSDECSGRCFYIAKYTSDGSLAWVSMADVTGAWAIGYSVAALDDCSFIVSGRFDGSAAFGANEANEAVLTSAGGDDVFIAKFNDDGALAWAAGAGGADDDLPTGLGLGDSGEFFVAGWISANATFGEGEANETELLTAGSLDAFLAKYNGDGTLSWARRDGGEGWDVAWSLASFSDGSPVLAGQYEGTVVFGEGEVNETVLPSDRDLYVAKYQP